MNIDALTRQLRNELEQCCSDEHLASYAAGELSAVRTAWVEDHVAHCVRCDARLALFPARDEKAVRAETNGWRRAGDTWQRARAIVAVVRDRGLAAIEGLELAPVFEPVKLRASAPVIRARYRLTLLDGSDLSLEFGQARAGDDVELQISKEAAFEGQLMLVGGEQTSDDIPMYWAELGEHAVLRLPFMQSCSLRLLQPQVSEHWQHVSFSWSSRSISHER